MIVGFLTPSACYLLGLIIGRGHIYPHSNRVVVEFAHKNKTVEGISTCEACGGLVTKNKALHGQLACKDCGQIAASNNANIYEQILTTQNGIKNQIIPFIASAIAAKFSILGNNTLTLLTIDFEATEDFKEIADLFPGQRDYSQFHIPAALKSLNKECKTEFINGLLDTAGFPSTGGWLNRDGSNGHGRMRAYFQVVRNWHLVVEIDNFLRSEFGLPVHTIDWGHPNIRDGNLKDFFDTNPTSWSREHQLKFFPEYYTMFRFRLEHKQALFEEFITHNARAGFNERWDWLPTKITGARLKAYHPGERDPRIPSIVRRHFDSFWQINLALGCEKMQHLIDNATYPESLKITGVDDDYDLDLKEAEFEAIRQKKTTAIYEAQKTKISLKTTSISTTKKNGLAEADLYDPLTAWLKNYLLNKYSQQIEVLDVSATNLNKMIAQSESSLAAFEFCQNYHISPDVVGFLVQTSQLAFIEAKITALNLENLGQLLGYCLVAQPVEAILVSTLQPSNTMLRCIQAYPEILTYGEGMKIHLAVWDNQNNSLNFINLD